MRHKVLDENRATRNDAGGEATAAYSSSAKEVSIAEGVLKGQAMVHRLGAAAEIRRNHSVNAAVQGHSGSKVAPSSFAFFHRKTDNVRGQSKNSGGP